MKFLLYFTFPILLLFSYGGCSSSGDNKGESVNRCFSELSENPCFDPNEGGTMTNVDDQTADEVVKDLESREDFLGPLDFTKILSTLGRSIFLPDLPPECIWEDSGLVIKTARDWNRYRNNCYFQDNFFDPPDVDFTDNMVIVSLDGQSAFGTEIVALLEFESELIAIVTDTVPDANSSEARFHGSFVVEVQRKDVPVSFMRLEETCNTIFNLENAECLAESVINRCESTGCRFTGGRVDLSEPNCSVIDCTSVSCEEIIIENFNIETVSGIISDISLPADSLQPEGIVNVNGENRVLSCPFLIE